MRYEFCLFIYSGILVGVEPVFGRQILKPTRCPQGSDSRNGLVELSPERRRTVGGIPRVDKFSFVLYKDQFIEVSVFAIIRVFISTTDYIFQGFVV